MSKKSDTKPQKYEFTPEDKSRVNRLVEEISGRLEELALISARSAGFALTGEAVRKFAPMAQKTFAAPYYIEIVCMPDGGPCGCIVLMDDGNHYFAMPCA
jgi:hypothetical protein